MAEPDDDVIAPPPRGQGSGEGPGRPPMVVPPNDARQLVRQGFYLGVGIAVAFTVISGALFLLALVLGVAALA